MFLPKANFCGSVDSIGQMFGLLLAKNCIRIMKML